MTIGDNTDNNGNVIHNDDDDDDDDDDGEVKNREMQGFFK